jgi:hypothetical protein
MEMKPITETTEYVTMSKDLFSMFIGLSFKGGLIHELQRQAGIAEISQDEAEQEMIASAMKQVNNLTS